ncbi:hypothetical protein ACFQ4K_29200 [Tistrella bauzanensis]
MTAASPLDILDPEIATFVRQMMADAAAHPPREQVTRSKPARSPRPCAGAGPKAAR